MSDVILDTSSLLALAAAQRSGKDRSNLKYLYGGLDSAIEAIVLYDQLLLDRPSTALHEEPLSNINLPDKLARFLPMAPDIESQIYSDILTSWQDHSVLPDARTTEFMEKHHFKVFAWDCQMEHIGPVSWTWEIVEMSLSGAAAELAHKIRTRAGPRTPLAFYCLTLLRTFYYNHLQQLYSADLVLHPLKNLLLERMRPGPAEERDHKVVRDEPVPSDSRWDGRLSPPRILGFFDETVRRAFVERRKKWLGSRDVRLHAPMLTSYVLNRCRTPADLLSRTIELRESRRAREFRQDLNHLANSLRSGDNIRVDEVLNKLEAASAIWAKNLHQEGPKRRIKISVPFLGIGTEFHVPDIPGVKGPGDRILVFIHEILGHA
jgi:hypothetical protein